MTSKPAPLLILVCWLGIAAAAAMAVANDQQEPVSADEVEEILGDFDDDELVQTEASRTASRERRFRLGGLLRLGASYNFAHQAPAVGGVDWRGLSRLRPEMRLEAETRFTDAVSLVASGRGAYDLAYSSNRRSAASDELLDTYQCDLELTDTYLDARLGRHVDLRIGRQVVAWGTSESLRVTDVVNPLDLREPGITDIEDLRLPLAMTRIDVHGARYSLTGLALHERRFDKTPVLGHDFYPYDMPLPAESPPAQTVDNTELALAAHGHFAGWDLSLFWADLYDDRPHVAAASGGMPELRHSRIEMFGAASAWAHGDLLVKAEAAHFRGLEYLRAPGRSLSRSELMVGFEYTGFSNTSLTLEAVCRRLHDHQPELAVMPDRVEQEELDWVFRLTRLFMHQRLTVTLVAITFEVDGEGGALQRLEGRYDLSDRVEITGGVVLYQSGDRAGFEELGDNDRLFLEVAYRF